MINTLLFASTVLAASEGDTPWLILLLGPAGAVGVYWALYRFYRNTDKSHAFERDTRIESQPVTGRDAKVDEIRGTQRRTIQGGNGHNHRERVQRLN